MSKAKPISLQTRRSKETTTARARAENSMLPVTELPLRAPPELKGHKIASDKWEELMRLYTEMEADLVSSLDFDLLLDYCMMTEYANDLDRLYSVSIKTLAKLERKAKSGKASAESVAGSIGYISESIVGINARAERQRMALQKLREALYLSPKARAGFIPAKKPAPPTPSEMAGILEGAGL